MVARQRRIIVWSPTALRDLDEALEYLAEQSPQAATNLLEEALAAADSLTTLSERGRTVPEIRDSSTRELFIQRYRLLYEVSAEQVAIVAFIHAARDFKPPPRKT